MWRDLRLGRRTLVPAMVVWIAMAAAPAFAAPGLPRGYDVQRIDSPNPLGGGAFGWGLASADLTGDGKADLLVAQAQFGPGQIFIFDGVTGRHIDTIDPPEKNPGNTNNEVLAFVYVETMPDIGSCPGGDGADADRICDLAAIGPGDGIPEIVAGSRNLKVNATDGTQAPVAADPNLGRAYVFDGRTRAVLKRIDMPQADRAFQRDRGASPEFGRLVMAPQGLAPCAGSNAENNAVGVGPCPPATDADVCRAPATADPPHAVGRCVRIGDVDGGGRADLVITARRYVETGGGSAPPPPSAMTGSQCRTSTAIVTCQAGKAWVYAGEAIADSDPREILETPLYAMQDPEAQAGPPEYGGNVFRVGDVAGVNAGGARVAPDGRPDFLVAARNLDYPIRSPDPAAFVDTGAAFLYDGLSGKTVQTIVHPEPQPRTQFSGSFNSGRAVGDLGATGISDFLLGAPLHNASTTDDGRAWVFNGDSAAGGGAEGSWQFATLSDPDPLIGGNFGGSSTGVGNLVDGPNAPANEVLVGGMGPFDPATEASNNNILDVHFMNPTMQTSLQTVVDPDRQRGSGFGVGLTPMGDLNGDGFLDFAASSFLANVEEAGQGRAYIFTSNDTPPAAPPAAPPTTPTTLKPGRCANRVSGTAAANRLFGSRAGDTIFGRAGADIIRSGAGRDCVDGGPGADRIFGGGGNDTLVGNRGDDDIDGGDGRDRVFGAQGRDDVTGGAGKDTVAAGPGSDRVFGGPGDDRMFGEGGRDFLVADGGHDFVDAGNGDDVVHARNRRRDVVLCGKGDDIVRADRVDSLNGCETVRRREAG